MESLSQNIFCEAFLPDGNILSVKLPENLFANKKLKIGDNLIIRKINKSGRPLGSLNKTNLKVDKNMEEIKKMLKADVPISSIAKFIKVHRITLTHHLKRIKLI